MEERNKKKLFSHKGTIIRNHIYVEWHTDKGLKVHILELDVRALKIYFQNYTILLHC